MYNEDENGAQDEIPESLNGKKMGGKKWEKHIRNAEVWPLRWKKNQENVTLGELEKKGQEGGNG